MADKLPEPIRILIVDDHDVLRSSLGMVLASRSNLEVVGDAGDGAQAISLAKWTRPDIVLLDLDLGLEQGLDLIPYLHEVAPKTRIVVLTGLRDPALVRRALDSGVPGLVSKLRPIEALVEAIECVHAAGAWLDPDLVVTAAAGEPPGKINAASPGGDPLHRLTRRERELVALVGRGLRNRELAQRLAISEPTVRHHLTAIFRKLGLANRLALMAFAARHGLTGPPDEPS